MQPPPDTWPRILLFSLPALLPLLVFALLTAGKTALEELNESDLRRDAEEGDPTAAKLLHRLENTVRSDVGVHAALALCVAAAVLLLPRRALDALAPGGVLRAVCAIAAALLTALLFALLGYALPRRLARRSPEKTARALGGAVSAAAVLFSPVSALARLTRLTGEDDEAVSEEEIRMMVDIGEEKGAIETDEREMIENIFEFNNSTAVDVMIHRTDVVMLWAGDTDEVILRTIEETGLSRYPVYEEDADDIIGILNSRDYFLNARRAEPLPLRELLRAAYFVPETVRADVLFHDMQSRKVHMAVVVDEYGGTSGIVTMEDLLEEIVGDIYDEFDPQDEGEIQRLEENLWKIAGGADLDDVSEALGIELPEDEEYGTLGGLVFAQLSVIPEDGSSVEVDACGVHIKVTELSDRRVEWTLVSLLPPEKDGEDD